MSDDLRETDQADESTVTITIDRRRYELIKDITLELKDDESMARCFAYLITCLFQPDSDNFLLDAKSAIANAFGDNSANRYKVDSYLAIILIELENIQGAVDLIHKLKNKGAVSDRDRALYYYVKYLACQKRDWSVARVESDEINDLARKSQAKDLIIRQREKYDQEEKQKQDEKVREAFDEPAGTPEGQEPGESGEQPTESAQEVVKEPLEEKPENSQPD